MGLGARYDRTSQLLSLPCIPWWSKGEDEKTVKGVSSILECGRPAVFGGFCLGRIFHGDRRTIKVCRVWSISAPLCLVARGFLSYERTQQLSNAFAFPGLNSGWACAGFFSRFSADTAVPRTRVRPENPTHSFVTEAKFGRGISVAQEFFRKFVVMAGFNGSHLNLINLRLMFN